MSNIKMKNIHDAFINILFFPRSQEYRIFFYYRTYRLEKYGIFNRKRFLLEKSFGPIDKGKMFLFSHGST